MTAGGILEGRGIEQKGQKTYGHVQHCGDCLGEGVIRRLNGH